MKPKPFSALNHFTVPDAILNLPWGSTRSPHLADPESQWRFTPPEVFKAPGNEKSARRRKVGRALKVSGNQNCNSYHGITRRGVGFVGPVTLAQFRVSSVRISAAAAGDIRLRAPYKI